MHNGHQQSVTLDRNSIFLTYVGSQGFLGKSVQRLGAAKVATRVVSVGVCASIDSTVSAWFRRCVPCCCIVRCAVSATRGGDLVCGFGTCLCVAAQR